MGAILTPSKTKGDQEVIKISSGDESEHELEVTRENQKPAISKKWSLSDTATGPPNKHQMIATNVIEVLDSDDELSEVTNIKISNMATSASNLNPNQHIKVEHGHEKMVSSSDRFPAAVNEAVRDKDGRLVLSQKVKVDFVEKLKEVPAHWPILPAGTNTAYVIG